MKHSSALALRVNSTNRDHHLWNNNGTWWVHYTIHPSPIEKERVRESLLTRDVEEARTKRDQLFNQLAQMR